jgi:hypothetical protein
MSAHLDGLLLRKNRKELNDRRIPWDTSYGFRRDGQSGNPRMHTNTTGTLKYIPVVCKYKNNRDSQIKENAYLAHILMAESDNRYVFPVRPSICEPLIKT